MDDLSVHEPFLLNEANGLGYAKKRPFLVPYVKWALKVTIWVIFIVWVSFIFLLPLEYVEDLFEKYLQATSVNVFGVTGSVFILFSGPILIIAFLSIAHLIIFGEEEILEKRTPKYPCFRLWTFPVIVDGPFGVFSAAELIGILLFSVYIIWAISVYTVRELSILSKEQLTSKEKSLLLLLELALRLGLIGLICLSFLFLPIAGGSVLLRLINIPFEHAAKYHVWLGHLTVLIFTLHGLFYTVVWTIQGDLLQGIWRWESTGITNPAGVISLAAGLLMWVTSLPPVRRQNFELFYYTHQLYIVFVIFLSIHVGDFIFSIAAGGIFLFMLDRFLRFCQSRKNVNIISATGLPCGTLKLVLSKPGNLRYNALSHIFLRIRELSWLQWHPFSVSSSPLDGKYHLSVHIKILGEWTAKLRGCILNVSEDSQAELPLQPHYNITASVEGPYGHESPYHLMYEDLILVAGGIGISPFLAILRDILHRIEDRKPCPPRNILVVWAVKRSHELSLLYTVDTNSICPSLSDALNLDIQTYVTRELEPPVEEGIVHKSVDSSVFPVSNRSGMSALVGTGNIKWAGIYVVVSTIGLVISLGLLDIFYINPFHITCWWCKGLLLVACMVASVFIFGGLVVGLWHLWERRTSAREARENEEKKISIVQHREPGVHEDSCQENISSTKFYGCRPDFKEIFGSISDRWGHVDVGVIVCGPPTLHSSVAKEFRARILRRRHNHPIFHFNSHSFNL